ncbi:MAG: MotA/TolQ/ExbB proton channel family protein [Kiritimatiellae bacterium]|nr:MotA/TolQ/ExbB proton channel family protein [Kiritimatiellia bacterium]
MPFDIPIANAWLAYSQSGGIGKAIVIGQLVLSMWVWFVMLERAYELKHEKNAMAMFREKFSKSRHLLDIYLGPRPHYGGAMAAMYRKACDRIASLLPQAGGALSMSTRLSEGRRELVKATLEESLSYETLRIERNMWVLALGASVAPLIGLFGTVLGIMQAFQAMGATGSALLSDVAPGLSSALLTTVVGLVVAIPSSVGYSMVLERIRAINVMLDAFADEFLGRLTLEMGPGEE